MKKHPVEWLVYVLMALAFALTAAAIFPGCGDPYEDRDIDEDVCNESCLDDDYAPLARCVCGRLIEERPGTQPGVLTCMCSCGRLDLETTWDWCVDPH